MTALIDPSPCFARGGVFFLFSFFFFLFHLILLSLPPCICVRGFSFLDIYNCIPTNSMIFWTLFLGPQNCKTGIKFGTLKHHSTLGHQSISRPAATLFFSTLLMGDSAPTMLQVPPDEWYIVPNGRLLFHPDQDG